MMRPKKFAVLLLAAILVLMPALLIGANSPTNNNWGPAESFRWHNADYSRTAGYQMGFGGLTGTAANNDTLYLVAYDYSGDGAEFTFGEWAQFGIDEYIGGGDFMLRVCMTADSAAPYGEERPIVAFDSDAGMVIVSPAFTTTVGTDEYVMAIHRTVLGKNKGEMRYRGTAALISSADALGTLQSATDSVYVPDLAGFGNDYFDLADFWLHVTRTTDGAAPQDQWRKILDSDDATGLCTFTDVFTAAFTALDEIELVHESLVPDNVRAGQPRYTSVIASGNTVTAVMTDLIGDFPDDYFQYGDYWFHMVKTTDGAAPVDEWRPATDWASGTGTVTFAPAITTVTALDVGELVHVSQVPEDRLPQYLAPNFLAVTVHHVKDDSVWSTVASHEVFNVTGQIEFWLMAYDSIATQGGDSILIRIGANKIFAMLANDWDAGEVVNLGVTPADYVGGVYTVYNPGASSTNSGVIADGAIGSVVFHGYSNDIDIGYEVQTNTLVNTGYSRWLIWWVPKDPTGTVAAGAGGAL